MTLPDTAVPTIAQARRMLSGREISVPELVEACLSRVAAYEDTAHAFVTRTIETARAEARTLQAELDAGRPRSPLHGIPIGLKDIYDTQGVLTTAHSKVLEDNIPAEDATTVTRLRQAGTVSLGKLSTWEFAIGGPSFDLPWPPATNPWNSDHDPGGSSSGTGAAVATGMVIAGMGTDTGGSIRIPAARCGIAGLKPSYGRVSRRGVIPLAWSLGHAGPMCWTAEDCALMLQEIAGHDPLDPASARAAVPDYTTALAQGIRGKRIVVPRHFFETDSPADADCLAAFEEALGVLRSLGATVTGIRLSPLQDYVACQTVISRSESYTGHEINLKTRPGDYGRFARERITLGAFYPAADYLQAQRRRRELSAEFARAMSGADLCVLPTLPGAAPPMRGQSTHAMLERPLYVQPFNVTGSPALSVCNGFSPAGLPFGLQIVGHPFDEAGVLAAGHAYEQATAWRARHANPLHPSPWAAAPAV